MFDRVFDGGFEKQQVAPQKPRQRAFDVSIGVGRASQAFLRASSMIVDPAPHVASSTVNGSAASTSPKYSKSLRSFRDADSWIFRTRRAIGSRPGDTLEAKPAGLSRREK